MRSRSLEYRSSRRPYWRPVLPPPLWVATSFARAERVGERGKPQAPESAAAPLPHKGGGNHDNFEMRECRSSKGGVASVPPPAEWFHHPRAGALMLIGAGLTIALIQVVRRPNRSERRLTPLVDGAFEAADSSRGGNIRKPSCRTVSARACPGKVKLNTGECSE